MICHKNNDEIDNIIQSDKLSKLQNMTIEEAQQAVDKWVKVYGVRYFSELTNMACLTEEVGELARVIARTYGDQLRRRNG